MHLLLLQPGWFLWNCRISSVCWFLQYTDVSNVLMFARVTSTLRNDRLLSRSVSIVNLTCVKIPLRTVRVRYKSGRLMITKVSSTWRIRRFGLMSGRKVFSSFSITVSAVKRDIVVQQTLRRNGEFHSLKRFICNKKIMQCNTGIENLSHRAITDGEKELPTTGLGFNVEDLAE